MKNRGFYYKIGVVLFVMILVCSVVYFINNIDYSDVAIQTIQDEVNLDAQNCTDGADDCKANTEFFTETWLYTGDKNFDRLINFPESVWEEKE